MTNKVTAIEYNMIKNLVSDLNDYGKFGVTPTLVDRVLDDVWITASTVNDRPLMFSCKFMQENFDRSRNVESLKSGLQENLADLRS